MTQTAHIDLKDGRRLDFAIRTSRKTRSVRLKLDAREGLSVTAPIGVPIARVIELVAGRSDWIAERLRRLDEVGHLVTAAAAVRPHAIDLPALCESWPVEYRETRARTVVARTDRSGHIVVSGAVADARACQAALRRWLVAPRETNAPAMARKRLRGNRPAFLRHGVEESAYTPGQLHGGWTNHPQLQAAFSNARAGALRAHTRALPYPGA